MAVSPLNLTAQQSAKIDEFRANGEISFEVAPARAAKGSIVVRHASGEGTVLKPNGAVYFLREAKEKPAKVETPAVEAPAVEAPEAKPAKVEAPAVDLHAALLDALKAAGIKATAKAAPSGRQVAIKVGKTTVALAKRQTSGNGFRLVVGLPKGTLPKGTKGFDTYRKGEGRFAYFTRVSGVEDVARVVPVVAAVEVAPAK